MPSNPVCVSTASGGSNTCVDAATLFIPQPGYACQKSICNKCSAGTYGTDGKTCKQCPFGTWAPDTGSTSCSNSFTYSSPGSQQVYIPYGVTKVMVRMWGGGGGGDISNDVNFVSHSGGGGGFTSCNITVKMSNNLIVVIAGGGAAGNQPSNSGGKTETSKQYVFGEITSDFFIQLQLRPCHKRRPLSSLRGRFRLHIFNYSVSSPMLIESALMLSNIFARIRWRRKRLRCTWILSRR